MWERLASHLVRAASVRKRTNCCRRLDHPRRRAFGAPAVLAALTLLLVTTPTLSSAAQERGNPGGVGSLVAAPVVQIAGPVHPGVVPASNGTCSITANTAQINCTGIPMTVGNTFVATVYDYQTGAPSVSSSSFSPAAVTWFRTVGYTSGVAGVSSSPALFAMYANVTTNDSTGWVTFQIGASGFLLVFWWVFPSAVAPLPRLSGHGSQGQGTSIVDPLSGTARGDTLVGSFASTRPTGYGSNSASWNYSAGPSNPPGSATDGVNGVGSWEWVNGSFSAPSPSWITQYTVDWTAISFTVSDRAQGSLPAAPTNLRVTGTTRTSVSLAWTNPSGTLTGDLLWVSNGACPLGGTPRSVVLPVSTQYSLTGLPSSSFYCFAVQAENGNGSSPFSSSVTAATPPVYGYQEKTLLLPGFDPLSGYFLGGAVSTQIPTLASGAGQAFGIFYVDNASQLVELTVTNDSVRSIAHVTPLYQRFGYGAPLGGMLDNEFFIDPVYDQALFFGTTTSNGGTYSLELANLSSGVVRMWNTSASIDPVNQQPLYVGNNTVLVMSSNCSILAYNLAAHTSWSAGILGASFGFGTSCFEANNVYWFPQKHQLVNVEAHGDYGDQVEQLDGVYGVNGEIQFNSVVTIAVDSGVRFNWVDGLAYNASTNEIAFTAGYWVAGTVYTYVVHYASNGLLTTAGETRYTVDSGGVPTGRLLEIQRYIVTSDYMLGQSYGPGAWTNGTQLLFDPWNGSLVTTNRTFDGGWCGNSCFEGQYASSADYLIDFSATLKLNNPMFHVVYAFRGAPTPTLSSQLTLSETGLPRGMNWSATLVGTGNFSGSVSNSSRSNSIGFVVAGGFTGRFAIPTVPGYRATPSSGIVNAPEGGGPVTIAITFALATNPLYSIYFNESGAPAGTTWSVILNGSTRSSTTASISFNEPNGTFAFDVPSAPGIGARYLPRPATGSATIHGVSLTVRVTFTAYFALQFVETGLPNGTEWSISLNGTTNRSAHTSIGFSVPNGSYHFDVGAVSGESSAPSSGMVNIPGTAALVAIAFAPSNGGSSNTGFLGLSGTTGYYVVGAIAGLIAAAAAVMIWRRQKRSPPEPEHAPEPAPE